MSSSLLRLPALNQATFVGRVATPPERVRSRSGVAARFRVAVMNHRSRGGGTAVIPCVAWGAIAESILDKLRPGAALLVSGALSTREPSKDMFVRVSAVQFLDEATPDVSPDITA